MSDRDGVRARRHHARHRLLGLLAVGAVLAGACSSSDDPATDAAAGPSDTAGTSVGTATAEDGPAWPVPEWTTTDPAAAGLDPEALDAMAAEAEAAQSNCLVVTKDGELVAEWYWNDWNERTDQEIFSATKSISSTLVGIAQDQGLLSIDDPASDYITEWQGTPSEDVTIRNLVSNDSGRFQDFPTDYVEMAVAAPDKTQFSIDLSQQHEPGTEWVYNNAAIQTLDRVIEVASGMPTHEFARINLFEPLGMETTIATDEAGNTLTFMGAQASCRDLARFGLLFARGGEWDGEQVVSAEWVEEATTPSQALNGAYGFLWWLNAEGPVASPTGAPAEEGQLVEGAPSDIYAALGLGNQIVAVFPSSGVVATRIGTQQGIGQSDPGPSFNLGDMGTGIQAAVGEPVASDGDGTGAADGAVGAG